MAKHIPTEDSLRWRRERDEARSEIQRLREAMASAATSLATGPLKDGYAYAVLTETLAFSRTQAP